MNDLNTQQIVLLCLLVSFVTAICTGITVVSLMQQEPEPVTQTIHRVVEKTVERVIEPSETKVETRVIEKTPEKEIVTLVVSEENAVTDAVVQNTDVLVRLYQNDPQGKRTFVGIGLIISSHGTVITDAKIVNTKRGYTGIHTDGEMPLAVDHIDTAGKYALLSLTKNLPSRTFSAPSFGDSSLLQLGQSLVSLSGSQNDVVSSGIATNLEKDETGTLKGISAAVDKETIVPGSIIFTLQGKIVGMHLSSQEKATFEPIQTLKSYISSQNI